MDILKTIIPLLISGLLSAIGTVLLYNFRNLSGKTEKQEERLNNLKETLPIDYVRRDDFVRWSIKIDRKIEKLFKEIQRIGEKK